MRSELQDRVRSLSNDTFTRDFPVGDQIIRVIIVHQPAGLSALAFVLFGLLVLCTSGMDRAGPVLKYMFVLAYVPCPA
jgi:hypothetical protein